MNPPNDVLHQRLLTAHAPLCASHDAAREELLATLESERPSAATRRAPARWPMLLVGLSTAAVVAVALVWGQSSPAVAMERLAAAMQEVSNYSYRMESVHVSEAGGGRTVWQTNRGTLRIEPIALHAAVHIAEQTGKGLEKRVLVDLEETHLADSPGIVIDHLRKEYWRTDEPIEPSAIPEASPQVLLYLVRQKRGQVVTRLGARTLGGKRVHGFTLAVDGSTPASDLGPAGSREDAPAAYRDLTVTVWVDGATDLPVEFEYGYHGDGFHTTFRYFDLRWNLELHDEAFSLAPPGDYQAVEKLFE